MLLEFSIVPLGKGEGVGDIVAMVIERVVKSGLPYRCNPMGTVIEGEWEEVMELVKDCHKEVLKTAPRVLTRISIDDRPGRKDMITGKIRSVEERLGRKLEKQEE